MSRKFLWRVSVTTSAEAEEALMTLLGEQFGQPASSFTDAETKRVTVSIYLPQKPLGWIRTLDELRSGIVNVRKLGFNPSPAKISLVKIRRESWAHSWKRHFKPLEIGTALLIKPSWNRRKPRQGQGMVILDPGLSFGTGQHPTTEFCLRRIVVALHERPSQTAATKKSFLDIGTGSGILAIAAVKLGCSPVHAFDDDPESVRVARANARQNRVTDRIRIVRQDLTRLPLRSAKKYDVVCANLISTLLIAERERIISRVKSKGVLVLAGILKKEFAQVVKAYRAHGLTLIASKTEKEWRSGAFVFRETS